MDRPKRSLTSHRPEELRDAMERVLDPARARKLTPRQAEVVATIRRLTAAHGYPPTIRELGVALGIGNHSVTGHLRYIAKKGWIDWREGQARTLRVLVADDAGAA